MLPMPKPARRLKWTLNSANLLSGSDRFAITQEKRNCIDGIHTRRPKSRFRAHAHHATRNDHMSRGEVDRIDVARRAARCVCLLLPNDAVQSQAKSRRWSFSLRTEPSRGRAITRRDALAFVQDVCALPWRTAAHDRRLMSDSIQRFVWTAQFGFYASHGHWTRIARYSFSDSNVEPQRGAREAVPGACRLRGLRLVSRELPPGVPANAIVQTFSVSGS